MKRSLRACVAVALGVLGMGAIAKGLQNQEHDPGQTPAEGIHYFVYWNGGLPITPYNDQDGTMQSVLDSSNGAWAESTTASSIGVWRNANASLLVTTTAKSAANADFWRDSGARGAAAELRWLGGSCCHRTAMRNWRTGTFQYEFGAVNPGNPARGHAKLAFDVQPSRLLTTYTTDDCGTFMQVVIEDLIYLYAAWFRAAGAATGTITVSGQQTSTTTTQVGSNPAQTNPGPGQSDWLPGDETQAGNSGSIPFIYQPRRDRQHQAGSTVAYETSMETQAWSYENCRAISSAFTLAPGGDFAFYLNDIGTDTEPPCGGNTIPFTP